jgi:hypothetical protein
MRNYAIPDLEGKNDPQKIKTSFGFLVLGAGCSLWDLDPYSPKSRIPIHHKAWIQIMWRRIRNTAVMVAKRILFVVFGIILPIRIRITYIYVSCYKSQ